MKSLAQLDVTHLSYLNPIDNSGEVYGGARENTGEKAFDQLVLPRGHKELVVSLISQHFRNKDSVARDKKQIDIIRGKGKIRTTHDEH